MKKILTSFLLCLFCATSFAQNGTKLNVIPTTTALWRQILQLEDVYSIDQVLGLPFAQIIITPGTNTFGLTNSTAYYFPTNVVASVPVGVYFVTVGFQTAATNTEVGFSTLDRSLVLGVNQSTNQLLVTGQLTVTNPAALYGFYVRQISTNQIAPVLSSNSVAWLYKIK